uniref:C-type lectin domain-containing protein n=1 Tax=Sparus aurata TaxID=8175 RepID=A0A671TER9_SPAAU
MSQENAQLSRNLTNTLQEKTELSLLLENRKTLQSSHCKPGWVNHGTRCYFMSSTTEKWAEARGDCLHKAGDLAVVRDAQDQAFLTTLTFKYVQQHPEEDFHSAWIGLTDQAVEGEFYWVDGKGIHPNVIFWRGGEPNNALKKNWLNTWDDIICVGKRHYICESTGGIHHRPHVVIGGPGPPCIHLRTATAIVQHHPVWAGQNRIDKMCKHHELMLYF